MLIGCETGGTILQSILIMPLLQLPQTPVKYACQETAYLIQNRYVMVTRKNSQDHKTMRRPAACSNTTIQT